MRLLLFKNFNLLVVYCTVPLQYNVMDFLKSILSSTSSLILHLVLTYLNVFKHSKEVAFTVTTLFDYPRTRIAA